MASPSLLRTVAALCALAAAPVLAAAAWIPVGPPGGDARSLLVDPRHPETVFLGTADGILYRSAKAGESWARVSPGFPLRGVSLDEMSMDSRGRLWVAYWEVAGAGGGVARSDDDGR